MAQDEIRVGDIGTVFGDAYIQGNYTTMLIRAVHMLRPWNPQSPADSTFLQERNFQISKKRFAYRGKLKQFSQQIITIKDKNLLFENCQQYKTDGHDKTHILFYESDIANIADKIEYDTWININDAVPKESGKVQFKSTGSAGNTHYYRIGEIFEYDVECVNSTSAAGQGNPDRVTHWKPIRN